MNVGIIAEFLDFPLQVAVEGMKPVAPRFWYLGEDFDKCVFKYKVTLDNTEKEFCFAFDVTAVEVVHDAGIPQRRLVKAAEVLIADYRRQNL